jgi:hypothetical protein
MSMEIQVGCTTPCASFTGRSEPSRKTFTPAADSTEALPAGDGRGSPPNLPSFSRPPLADAECIA